jgi:pseudouridine synthase
MERLQKYLARSGVASRRAAERLIANGLVAVNGQVVTEPGVRVEAGVDVVEIDGRRAEPPASMVYLALHKPPGVVTTTSDQWGRPTVLDLLPKLGRIFPIGRLDADSEGLLLLTTDGELANRVMHPRYGCHKEYRALVRGTLDLETLERLRRGVDLDDGRTAPAQVELDEPAGEDGGERRRWVRVTLREGRKRQVRRMLAAVGLNVDRLVRVGVGPIGLGNLPVGSSRPLGRSEVAALRAACGGTT